MIAPPCKPRLVNLTWVVIALVGLSVLYLLSLGPSSVLMTHFLRADYGSEQTEAAVITGYNVVYAPLDWLLERAPWWISDPYYEYLALWDV